MERRQGSLVCEQVVVPAAAGKLPPVVWSYFDPRQGRYNVLRQVVPEVAAACPKDTAMTPVPAAVPQSYPVRPDSHESRKLFWLLAAIVLAGAAAGFGLWWNRHHKPCSAPQAEILLLGQYVNDVENALNEESAEKFYNNLFVILQQITGTFFPLPDVAITETSTPVPALSPYEKQLCTLFQRCNCVRYGRLSASRSNMEEDLSILRSLLEKRIIA
jgi:hypothetical protein